jgi:hypothetical protein
MTFARAGQVPARDLDFQVGKSLSSCYNMDSILSDYNG